MSNGFWEAPPDGAPSAPAYLGAESSRTNDDPSGRMGIVVVNYGSSNLVARNLGDLDLESRSTDVILVDNFSSAEETDRARALARARGWHFVAMPTNVGFGAGVNAGIREADRRGCTCFLLLNPDAVVSPRVIDELRAHSLREPLELITPRLESSRQEREFGGSRLDLRTGDIRGSGCTRPMRSVPWRARPSNGARNTVREWLPATCLAVHRELFARVGGFDEPYFLYWEDVDFSYRCVSAGAVLRVRDDLVAVHDAGGTQGPQRGRAKSDLYYRYNCRNRLLFAARHLRSRELCDWILYTPMESWQILLRGGRRQVLQSPGPMLAAIRGSLEGLRLAAAALVTPGRMRGGPYLSVVTDRATAGVGGASGTGHAR